MKKASQQYADGSVWKLTKTVLDTVTAASFISTTVPFRIDLAKSKLDQFHEEVEMPDHPVPQCSVADVDRIITNKSTVLMAVIKSVGRERQSKNGTDIADVQLMDDSVFASGQLATVTVGVFGKAKIATLKSNIGHPMVFFNLSGSCATGHTNINHYMEELLTSPPRARKQVCFRTNKLFLPLPRTQCP